MADARAHLVNVRYSFEQTIKNQMKFRKKKLNKNLQVKVTVYRMRARIVVSEIISKLNEPHFPTVKVRIDSKEELLIFAKELFSNACMHSNWCRCIFGLWRHRSYKKIIKKNL